jgi:hypothetical protein
MRLGLRARLREARASRLASAPRRRRLAGQIEHVVVRADRPPTPFTATVPVSHAAVREAHGALLDLAERLRGPRPVDPEGVLLARALLVDGSGPLYVDGSGGELRAAAERALAALDGHGGRH